MASCQRGAKNQRAAIGRLYHLQFNPRDSSTYRYTTTSEVRMSFSENGIPVDIHKTSRIIVNYVVSKDTGEVLLEMTFDKIDYQETGRYGDREVDVANEPGPLRELLNRMKTATIFARVRIADMTVTYGGEQEIVDQMMDSYYKEGDLEQAKSSWGHWAEGELVWKNLDPLVWATLDSARQLGDQWNDTSTNEDEINFKVNKRYQFYKIDGQIATIRADGEISNDNGDTWLDGKKVMGRITGSELGTTLVDTATGMPVSMSETLHAGGDVDIEGMKTRITFSKSIRMEGGKVN